MRPLWEAYLIEGLEGDRAACFFKAHHSIMDGVGSLAVFDALTQAHRAEPVRVTRRPPVPPSSPPALRFARWAGETAGNAAAGIAAAARDSLRAVLAPRAVAEDVARSVRGVRGLIADLTAPGIPDPLAHNSTGIGRRLDATALSVARLAAIGCALEATLNDIVLTVVAGAVGRYHRHRHIEVDVLQCMVPVSLRQRDERGALGNRVGAFTVALPVGDPDPLARLERIQVQTRAAKSDRRGAAYPLVTHALALLPGFAYRLLARYVTGRINLICTNVPGPPAPRYLAGAKIEAIFPFAPVALGTPLTIALLSYGDTYGIGIDTDPAAIPDPELLSRYLTAEVENLEARVLPRRRQPAARRAIRPRTARRTPRRGRAAARA
jgi:WS/DGAT/MGAT family acyltransferase